jgi:hypothetical protein
MAYKFSKGDRKFGDIKAEGDAQGDTLIDFEEDQIDFQTSGSVRMRIENDTITTTVPIHISGSVTEGLRIAKAGADYREIQFETNGVDTAFIQVDASEGMIIGCQSDNDEIIFMTKATGQSIAEVARMTANGRLGIQEASPSKTLDVGGDVFVSGTIQVGDITIPNTDGTNGQVLKTDGNGVLTWQNESAGGGEGSSDNQIQTITGSTGTVTHDCTNSKTFYHENVSGSFVVNLTNLDLSSGYNTEVSLIISQGSTGYLPTGVQISSVDQTLTWEGESYPSPSTNNVDIAKFNISNIGGNYLVLGDYLKYNFEVVSDPVTSGSILHLDASDASSYGGSGTTWTDLSSGSNNATLVGSPSYSSATNLFTFNGSNQYVTLPSGFADFSNGITLFFVADLAGTSNSYERMIDLSNGADVDNILFSRDTTTTGLRYDIRDGTSGNTNVVASNGVLNNTLASYAAVDDGTNIKLYRNGVLLTTGTSNLPVNKTRTTNYLAKSPWNDGYLEGSIGVAIVYDRALSSDEIEQNHGYYAQVYSL